MIVTEPMPYESAVAAARRRTPVGAVLTSKEWEQVPLALKDRAFWSAQQTNVSFLAKAKGGIDQLVAGKTDRATQRLELRKLAESLGLAPAGGDGGGGVDEIGSDARLNLILDMGLRDAQGRGAYLDGQNPVTLENWPAWELFDTNPNQQTKGRRDWPARWIAAGGPPFFGNRMIALKTDPVWAELSRFGQPWAPLDYNSYWEMRAVDYDTAVEAGLIERGEVVTPKIEDWNAKLEASLPEAGGEYARLLQATFGDQLATGRDGKLTWQGSKIAKLYERALADDGVKWSLDLGQGTQRTRELARAAGVELRPEATLKIDADHVRHANRRHGEGESRGDQRPLTALDFELVPHVWRDPDAVRPGDQVGDLVFEKRLGDGRQVFATWKPAPKSGAVRLHSLLVKKEGGQP